MSLPAANESGDKYALKVQVVAFHLAGAEYAAEIEYIEEINRLTEITRVPRAASYIEGVINLRGSIIPVINLHKKFNLAGQRFDGRTRIIVFQINGVKAAIIVDSVTEVVQLDVSNITDDTPLFGPVSEEVFKGMVKVGDRLIIILDLEKLLNAEIN